MQAAEQLFARTAERDGTTHNAMVLAAGLAWRPFEAETHLQLVVAGGFAVLSSSYCALIAAYWCAAQHLQSWSWSMLLNLPCPPALQRALASRHGSCEKHGWCFPRLLVQPELQQRTHPVCAQAANVRCCGAA